MNLADGLRPTLADEDLFKSAPGADAARAAVGEILGDAGEQEFSPQWLQAFEALEQLRQALNRHQVLVAHPDIQHDFIAVLASIESLRGDKLFEAYWRAQQVRLVNENPNMKDPPVQTVIRTSGARQQLSLVPAHAATQSVSPAVDS